MERKANQLRKKDIKRIALLECAMSEECMQNHEAFLKDLGNPAKHGFRVVDKVIVDQSLACTRSQGMFSAVSVVTRFSLEKSLLDVWRKVKEAYPPSSIYAEDENGKSVTPPVSGWSAHPRIVGVLAQFSLEEAERKCSLKHELFWVGHLLSHRCRNGPYAMHRAGFSETAELFTVAMKDRLSPTELNKDDFSILMTLMGGKDNRLHVYPLPSLLTDTLVDEFKSQKWDKLIEDRGLICFIMAKLHPPDHSLITIINILYQTRWFTEAEHLFTSMDAAILADAQAEWSP